MLRILLLSDIHFFYIPNELDDHHEERKEFLKDLMDFHKRLGNFDHVLVCGDIVYSGEQEQYVRAHGFFKKVSEAVGCPSEEFYVVPGNHDKNRKKELMNYRLFHSGLSNEASNTESLFDNLLINNFDSARNLINPFSEYYNFAYKLNCNDILMGKCIDAPQDAKYDSATDKAYSKEELHQLDGYRVFLYGFNTALISDNDDIDDKGKGHKLFLSKLSYNADTEDGCINIAMMHHPLETLINSNEIGNILDNKFQIQIFGHLHRPESSNKKALHILLGAFQPPEYPSSKMNSEYLPSYQILELRIKHMKGGQDVLIADLSVEQYRDKKFHHINNQSQTFEIQLLPKHKDRWADVNRERKNQRMLPKDITIRKIEYEFLQSPKATQLMKDFKEYDNKKSFSLNSIAFLKKMETKNQLTDLWDALKKDK